MKEAKINENKTTTKQDLKRISNKIQKQDKSTNLNKTWNKEVGKEEGVLHWENIKC